MSMNPSRYPPEELPFKVEEWTMDGKQVAEELARCRNVLLGRAAFQEAVKQEPGKKITLSHGARLIEVHEAE